MQRRLLCIYPWLTMGGADKFNLDMLSQLHQRDWEIEIVTTLANEHAWWQSFAALATRITEIGQLEPAAQPGHMLAAIAAAQPDVVLISHSRLGYALLPYLRAQHPSVSFVDYNHLVDPDDPQGGYPYTSIQHTASLDMQIVSSQALRDWMLAHGGDATRIVVCTTNVDDQLWNSAHFQRATIRAQLGIPEQAFVGLYAARFEAIKQPVQSLEIMRRVVSACEDAYFLIAGQGSYAPFLRSRIGQVHLEQRIQLLGALPNERIRELLAASDMLLLSSRSEGISLAIYEAMAMGVVPVSVDASGQSELVTPQTGILIKHSAQDIENYSAAIVRLTQDRQQLHSMGSAARQRIALYYRLDQMGDRMHSLLLEAMQRHSAQAPTLVSAQQARDSVQAAIELAEQDARWAQAQDRPLARVRRAVRTLYWQLVEQGAWWLVPALERVRAIMARS